MCLKLTDFAVESIYFIFRVCSEALNRVLEILNYFVLACYLSLKLVLFHIILLFRLLEDVFKVLNLLHALLLNPYLLIKLFMYLLLHAFFFGFKFFDFDCKFFDFLL